MTSFNHKKRGKAGSAKLPLLFPPFFFPGKRHFDGAGYYNKTAGWKLLNNPRQLIVPATEKSHGMRPVMLGEDKKMRKLANMQISKLKYKYSGEMNAFSIVSPSGISKP